jgi:tetratricopeptide (TPR) repeat protein
MRIKSDAQMEKELLEMNFPQEMMDIFVRTSAISVNITQNDIDALESFSGTEDQEEFVLERLAQYYQYEKKDYNKAILIWTSLMDYNCLYKIEALINITACYTNVNNYPDAFGSIEFASAINNDPKIKTIIDGIIAELNEKASKDECNRIREIDKIMETGDFDGAIKECDKVIAEKSDSKAAHYRKARILALKGEEELARAEFLKS